ncbi:MAG: flagellar motor protein MotB [Methylocystis sp.]|nr:MAG: flagellar motor protein MotB [Methylocystis sp.]
MSEGNAPIIIRRKRVEGEEEHHGGVWKLAFADFMTAMMAFFLVMWLINSTSKETKAAIVQYFNPVQLIDSNPAHKGLRDPKPSGQGKSPQKTENAGATDDAATGAEAALHAQPIKALDEIAKREPPPAAPPPHLAPSQLRDPFDRAPMSPPPSAPLPAGEAKAGLADLRAALERVSRQEAHAPKVEVTQAEEGILISLTDDANFSMFAVGSIEPRPQLVRIIGQIGKILRARRGEIEIRGHTDARSYAGKSYDNWRLSSDRATIVHYMLLRGGLPGARVEKIVGYADRRLKAPGDPLAPINRRIEILLRGDGG